MNAVGRSAASDLPRSVVSAGVLLVVLVVLPWLPHAFAIPKESVVCLAGGLALVLMAIERNRTVLPWSRWWIAVLVAPVALVTITAFLAGCDMLASDGPVRWWSYALFLLAAHFACNDAHSSARLIRVVVELGAIEGALVVVQVLWGQHVIDTSHLPSAKWRAFGTLGNPNWVGAFLAATLPLSLARVHLATAARERTQSALMAGAVLAGLILTLARGAWLAAAGGIAALILLRPGLRWGRLAPLVGTACILAGSIAWVTFGSSQIVAAVTRAPSIEGRIRMWRGTVAMIAARPVRGWGAGRFAATYPPFQRAMVRAESALAPVTDLPEHPHNEFLFLAAESGIVALIALIAVWYLSVRTALGAAADSLLPVAAALVALAIDALGDVPLRLPATAVLFCILLVHIFTVAVTRNRTGPLRRLRRIERVALVAGAILAMVQGGRLLFVDGRLGEVQRAVAAGNAQGAQQIAERALRLESTHAELWSLLAQARAAAGDDTDALAAAERAWAIWPDPPLAYLIADIERRKGHAERALAVLSELSETLPGLLRPRLLLAETYAEMGDVPRAAAALRELMLVPAKLPSHEERDIRAQAARTLSRLEPHD